MLSFHQAPDSQIPGPTLLHHVLGRGPVAEHDDSQPDQSD